MPPSATFALPRDVRAPYVARIVLRDLLASRAWASAKDAELVVSELVANAVEHGAGEIALTLWLAEGRIRGEVTDTGTGPPPRLPGPDEVATGGRGLMIVDALSDRWGAAGSPSRVWFEMTTTREDDV